MPSTIVVKVPEEMTQAMKSLATLPVRIARCPALACQVSATACRVDPGQDQICDGLILFSVSFLKAIWLDMAPATVPAPMSYGAILHSCQ